MSSEEVKPRINITSIDEAIEYLRAVREFMVKINRLKLEYASTVRMLRTLMGERETKYSSMNIEKMIKDMISKAMEEYMGKMQFKTQVEEETEEDKLIDKWIEDIKGKKEEKDRV